MKRLTYILKMLPLLIIISACISFNPISVLIVIAATSLIFLAYFCQLFEEGFKGLLSKIN